MGFVPSQLRHHHADVALRGAAAGDDAADLAAAQNKYSVAQFKKHVKILADVDNGNALLLLAVYKVIYSVGRIDVQSANSVSREQNGRCGCYLASDKHLLNIAAGEAAHGGAYAGSYDVKLVNPKFTLTSDTLRYNSQTKIANIVGPSDIVSDQNHIYSELGFYNTTSGEAILLQRSVLTNQQRQLVGDSLFYNRNKGYGEAFRNVVMTDTENKNLLTGEYGFYDELKGNALVTDSALAINYSQNNDSLYMHGDTLRLITYNMNTDSVYRKTFVYHKVRIYKSDLQGVCDSLVFNSQDSCMTMYHDPIVWNGKQQLFGEEIRAYMNDSTIDWAHIINQAMSIEQIDSVHYNQVSGKEIKAYFTGGDLRQVDVIGNVRLGYFPVDGKDSTLIGYISAESTLMNVYLMKRKVQKIKMTTQTDGVMYPMLQIPEDKLYLPSFAWFDYIRPLNKDDVFRWRGKKAGQELKKSVQRKPPLPTLKGLLKK